MSDDPRGGSCAAPGNMAVMGGDSSSLPVCRRRWWARVRRRGTDTQRSAIVPSPCLRQLRWHALVRQDHPLAFRGCGFDSVISFTMSSTERSTCDRFPERLTSQNRRRNGKYPHPRRQPSQSWGRGFEPVPRSSVFELGFRNNRSRNLTALVKSWGGFTTIFTTILGRKRRLVKKLKQYKLI